MDRERAEVMGERRPASTSAEGRSSDEIRRDMETTRADLHDTVDALERKLSPGQLLDELWGRVKSGEAGAVGGVVRDHPVPLALMGLGVAWLAVEQMTGSPGSKLRDRHGEVGSGTYEPAEGRVGPYRGDAVAGDDDGASLKDRARDAASSAKSGLSSARDKLTGMARDVASSAREKASEAKHRVEDRAESLRHSADDVEGTARYRARQAKRGFREALDEHPMALGAVAFGLGLAGGLAAPSTRLEDRVMGDAARAVKDEAKEEVKDIAEGARHVAEDAARAAKDEADRSDVVGDLNESAKRVASEAKRAAKDRAASEDLDAEGMKARGRQTAKRTKDEVTG